MTKNSTIRIPWPAVCAACGLFLVVAAPSARAKAEVYPSLSLGLGYSENLGYATENFEESDVSASLGFRVPIVWARRTGSTALSFNGTYIKQSDVESLDRFNWGASLAHGRTATKRTQLSFLAAFVHTQSQGNPENLDDSEIFLTRRAERDLAQVKFDVRTRILRRWNWNVGVEAQHQSSNAITEFEDEVMLPSSVAAFEDKLSYGLRTGIDRQFNERAAFGFEAQYRIYDLDISGEQNTLSAGLTFNRVLNEVSTFNMFVGGYRATGEAADGVGTADEDDGYQVGVGYTRALQKVGLSFGLTHVPSSGGNLQGTATQSAATVGVSNRFARTWDWNMTLRYGLREPADPIQPDRDSTALNFDVERFIGRTLGVNLASTFVVQTTDDPAIEDRESLNFIASFVWYPRGRRANR